MASFLCSLPVLSGCVVAHDTPQQPPGGKWALAWSDEFSVPNGATPDSKKWTYDIGGKGWGNQELEYYTNRKENARIENGNLVITALRETYTGADGLTRDYTSARLKTQGLFTQAYGRFEARIKIPEGQGMWPAFWMLGEDISSDGWPKCGEIDIMENVGKEPGAVRFLTGQVPSDQLAISQQSLACPPARALRTTSIFMPWSGNRPSFAFTSIRISMPPSTPRNGPRAASGFSTILFTLF